MKLLITGIAIFYYSLGCFGQTQLIKKIENTFDKTNAYYLYESVIRSMYRLIDDQEKSNFPGTIEKIVSIEIKGDSTRVNFKTIQSFLVEENLEIFMELSNVDLSKDFLGLQGISLGNGKIKRLKVYADEGNEQVNRLILLMRSASNVHFISIKGELKLEAIPDFLNKIKAPSKLINAE